MDIIHHGEAFTLNVTALNRTFSKSLTKKTIKKKIKSLFAVATSDIRRVMGAWVYKCLRDHPANITEQDYKCLVVCRSTQERNRFLNLMLSVKVTPKDGQIAARFFRIQELSARYSISTVELSADLRKGTISSPGPSLPGLESDSSSSSSASD